MFDLLRHEETMWGWYSSPVTASVMALRFVSRNVTLDASFTVSQEQVPYWRGELV
jgi:hypothetical protein